MGRQNYARIAPEFKKLTDELPTREDLGLGTVLHFAVS